MCQIPEKLQWNCNGTTCNQRIVMEEPGKFRSYVIRPYEENVLNNNRQKLIEVYSRTNTNIIE